MNPIAFALSRPATTMMMVVALIGGVQASSRVRVDIFPALDIPKDIRIAEH